MPRRLPRRRRAGVRAAGRGGGTRLAVVALIWSLFPIVFIVSAALNPAGTLETSQLLPDQCVARQLQRPVHRRRAAVRVLVQELPAHRRRRLAVLGLHRRVRGVRLLPTAVQRPPARACWPCCCCRCSPRCSRSWRSTSPSSPVGDVLPALRPQQPLGPDPRLPRRGDGGQRVAAQGLLRHGARASWTRRPRSTAPRHARIFFTMTLRLVMPILVTVFMVSFVGPVQRVPARQHLPARHRHPDPGRRPLRHDDRQGDEQPVRPVRGRRPAGLGPTVLLYLAFQKQLVGGLTQGSVK